MFVFCVGTNIVKCSVLKDEHTFLVHVLDPHTSKEQLAAETDTPKSQVLESSTQPQHTDSNT